MMRKKTFGPAPDARNLQRTAMDNLNLSARAHDRILKVALFLARHFESGENF